MTLYDVILASVGLGVAVLRHSGDVNKRSSLGASCIGRGRNVCRLCWSPLPPQQLRQLVISPVPSSSRCTLLVSATNQAFGVSVLVGGRWSAVC